MNRLGKLALSINEHRNNRHAILRRVYKRRAHKMERRIIRIVLSDARVRSMQP